MSAKIYDTTSQAFVDAETPKVNSGGVFIDAEGKVYSGGAWEDAWSGSLPANYIIKDGKVNSDIGLEWVAAKITSAWDSATTVPTAYTITQGSGYCDILNTIQQKGTGNYTGITLTNSNPTSVAGYIHMDYTVIDDLPSQYTWQSLTDVCYILNTSATKITTADHTDPFVYTDCLYARRAMQPPQSSPTNMCTNEISLPDGQNLTMVGGRIKRAFQVAGASQQFINFALRVQANDYVTHNVTWRIYNLFYQPTVEAGYTV